MDASNDAVSAGGHTPVLYQNVLSGLNVKPAGRYIDGTVGAGGHATGVLLASNPSGALLGLDRDAAALELAGQNLASFGERAKLRHASFTRLEEEANALGWNTVDGILLDLGLSSMQVDRADRGFSFRLDGPLDMRFDNSQGRTAAELLNGLSEAELADLIWKYGEEKASRRIARAIVKARPISSTRELADIVSIAIRYKEGRIHPATKTFQALRIAVNNELSELAVALDVGLDLLASGGRFVVLAYHSLEDRIVKQRFRTASKDCICPPEQRECDCDHPRVKLLTKKPIRPDQDELLSNPRSRSVRMRCVEKLPEA